jgi:hypothetical protein
VSILRQLTAKPWVTAQARVDDFHPGGTFALPTAKLGLRVFLAVVTVLFMLLILAYGSRMEFEDFRPAPQQRILWLNTAMLVLSSMAMQWAQVAARHGNDHLTLAAAAALEAAGMAPRRTQPLTAVCQMPRRSATRCCEPKRLMTCSTVVLLILGSPRTSKHARRIGVERQHINPLTVEQNRC